MGLCTSSIAQFMAAKPPPRLEDHETFLSGTYSADDTFDNLERHIARLLGGPDLTVSELNPAHNKVWHFMPSGGRTI